MINLGAERVERKESSPGFVNASDYLYELGQAQYVLRPLTNIFPDDYPNLGEGLRWEGSYGSYHDIKIHKDDVLEYASRYIDWKNQTSLGRTDKEKVLEKIKKELSSQ